MYQNQQVTDYTHLDTTVAQQRNKVLKNTYWLLALSMVPTVIGAYIGVKLNIFAVMSFWTSLIVFFGVTFGLMFVIQKTKDSALGVVFLLAFTFFMGLWISQMLGAVLRSYSNGSQLIALAAGGTGAIFFAMATLATIIKRDLSGLGKFLFIGLIMLIVAMVANFFLHSSALSTAISAIAVGIFSAYILYDMKRIIDGGETNYITATLSIYLDIINLFIHLLNLLSIFSGRR